MKLHVIVADHQVIFRTGVARVLAGDPMLEIVAQCADLPALHSAIAAAPGSLVIFPASLTEELPSLLAAIEQAGCRPVLILEDGVPLADDLADVLPGTVLRSVGPPQLLHCLHRVAAGERWRHTAAPAADRRQPDNVGERVLQRLTPKELRIIRMVTDGAKNKDIAIQLGTKEQVIKNYLRSIYDKTGVSDRLELALFTVHHPALAEATEPFRPQRPREGSAN